MAGHKTLAVGDRVRFNVRFEGRVVLGSLGLVLTVRNGKTFILWDDGEAGWWYPGQTFGLELVK